MRAKIRGQNQEQGRSLSGILVGLFILLATAMPGKMAPAQTLAAQASHPHCNVSVTQMKCVIDKTLGGLRYVTDSEKTFVHLQHEKMSCDDYSRIFENSGFFRDERQRRAIAEWHWRVYHADSKDIHDTAIRHIEETLTAYR